MRVPLFLVFLLLLGCAYTQPKLVRFDSENLDNTQAIINNLNFENRNIKVVTNNNGTITLFPLYDDLYWQKIEYTISEIQKLLNVSVNYGIKNSSRCYVKVEVIKMAHKAKPVGLGFDVVYVEGDFLITSSCLSSVECKVHATYSTDYFYATDSSNNKRYSEAIIGVILNAVVAAQDCETEAPETGL